MFTRIRFASFLLVILVCMTAVAAAPQQNNPQTLADADNKIYLDVVVSPKSGPPVTGLQQQDFTLLDNKLPQTITSFQAFTGREAQVQVVLVIDAVNTDAQNIGYERIQIDKFLRAEGGHLAYPVAIAVFTDKGIQTLTDFSTDGNALSAALDSDNIALRFINRSAGFYGAAERLQLSLQAMHQLAATTVLRPTRKIVLWVSPGWPLLSGPRVDLDSKQQQEIFADVVGFSTQLRQARITLYSVNPLGAGESVFRGSYYEEFLNGVSKPTQVNAGNLALPVLALQSGGRVLDFNNDLTALLQQCMSDIAPYYEISFDPALAERPNEYHHLEVKVDKPGLTARTRQNYYAQPSPRN
jgi:VWFA-related protein